MRQAQPATLIQRKRSATIATVPVLCMYMRVFVYTCV